MNSKKTKRGVAILLSLLFILTPVISLAHQAYFFQVLIDNSKFSYKGSILSDDDSFITGLESSHIEVTLGNFKDTLVGHEYKVLQVPDAKGEVYKDTGGQAGEQIMPYTFSPVEAGDKWFDGKIVNNAGKNDVNRAYLINDTLTSGLNDALFILNKGEQYKNQEDFLNMSVALSAAINASQSAVWQGGTGLVQVGTTGYTLQVEHRASYSQDEKDDLKNGISNKDYLVITAPKADGGEEFEYVYRMEKGYQALSQRADFKWDNKLFNTDYNLSGDVKYITWNMMMYQGFYSLFAKNLTAKDGGSMAKPSIIEEMITGLVGNLINGIRNLLGLYSMNELIYNEGIRGSRAYFYGAMPQAWSENVELYHWIFQAIAWSLISFAIVKLLIARNISTINPSSRVSLIAGIQDLLLTGVVLAFVMPLINMLLSLNAKIVDVFAAVGPDLDNMTGLNEYTNVLSGVLLQCFYLIILIWLNFTYIMRSITIAILVTLSPIFVVTLSLGGKWKGLFTTWMKEISTNIFLQSFHAFMIGFLYMSQLSSRGIEMAVLCYAMIPLTEFFRSLMMGQSGGFVGDMAGKSLSGMASFAMDKAKDLKGKSNTIGQQKLAQGNASGGAQTASSTLASKDGVAKSGVVGGDIKTGSSDRFTNRTKHQDTRNAKLEKQIPLDIARKGPNSQEYKDFMGGDGKIKSEFEAKRDDFVDNLKSDAKNLMTPRGATSAGIAGLKMGAGALGVMAGAGYALAMGATDSSAIGVGRRLSGSSAKLVGRSAAPGLSAVGSTIREGVGVIKAARRTNPASSNPMGTGAAGGSMNPTGRPLPSGAKPLANGAGAQVVNRSLPSGAKLVPGGSGSTTVATAGGKPAANSGSYPSVGGTSGGSGTNAPKTTSSDLGGYQWATSVGKGNSDVYRDAEVLSEQGLLRAHEDDNGNAVYAYDVNKMSEHDRNNMRTYMNTFASKDEGAIQHLQSHGVQGVWMDGNNNMVVSYNQTGKEAMGIKSVRTSGGSIIETKRADQPMTTKMSVDIPPIGTRPTATQSQGQSGGNYNGNPSGNYNANRRGNSNGNQGSGGNMNRGGNSGGNQSGNYNVNRSSNNSGGQTANFNGNQGNRRVNQNNGNQGGTRQSGNQGQGQNRPRSNPNQMQ